MTCHWCTKLTISLVTVYYLCCTANSGMSGVAPHGGLDVPAEIEILDTALNPNWGLLDNDICGVNIAADRIIGGKNAKLGQYPWLVRISYYRAGEIVYLCGGAIVNKLYVVTAAHCVYSLPDGVFIAGIRVGELNAHTNPDCENGNCADPVQDFWPAEIIYHSQYGKPKFRNDIALIRLDRKINYNDYVRPICLMSGPLLNKSYVGELGEVAGWGIYDLANPQPSKILQTLKLRIIDNKRCEEVFKQYATLSESQLCVGGEVGYDSCGGDSGVPLMKVDVMGRQPPKYYLIGVVSFGSKKCGATNMPGIYTYMKYFTHWILHNMHQ